MAASRLFSCCSPCGAVFPGHWSFLTLSLRFRPCFGWWCHFGACGGALLAVQHIFLPARGVGAAVSSGWVENSPQPAVLCLFPDSLGVFLRPPCGFFSFFFFGGGTVSGCLSWGVFKPLPSNCGGATPSPRALPYGFIGVFVVSVKG